MKYVYTTAQTNNTYFNEAYDTPEEAVEMARLTAMNWNNLLAVATGKVLPVPAEDDTARVVAVVEVPVIKTGAPEPKPGEYVRPTMVSHAYMTPDAYKAAKKENDAIDGTEIVCLDWDKQ